MRKKGCPRVKADGTLSNSYTYSAYGSTLTISEATGASQPYRYGAGYTDTTTGLIKLGIRYYDPAQARFTQLDPTGQDPHYQYANACPSSLNDPTGAASLLNCAVSSIEFGLDVLGAASNIIAIVAATPLDPVGIGLVIQAISAIEFAVNVASAIYDLNSALTACKDIDLSSRDERIISR